MTKDEILKIAKQIAGDTVAPFKDVGNRSSDRPIITVKEQPFSISKYLQGALYGFPKETTVEKARYIEVNKVLTEGVGASGGFFVPPEYSTTIIDDLRAMAVVRSMGATVFPINTDTLRLPRVTSSTSGTWMATQNTEKTGTDPAFGQLELVLKEYAGIWYVSNALIKHASPAIDVYIKSNITKTLALAEDLAFLEGVGGAQPTGVYNYTGVNSTATAAAINYNNLVTAITTIETNNDKPSAWLMHPQTKGSVMKLENSTGDKVWYTNNTSITEAVPDRLLGLPVYYSTQVSTSCTAAGALSGGSASYIMLGNWSDLAIAQDSGAAIELEVSREGGNSWAYNQTSFRATIRRDSAPMHPASFYVIKGLTI